MWLVAGAVALNFHKLIHPVVYTQNHPEPISSWPISVWWFQMFDDYHMLQMLQLQMTVDGVQPPAKDHLTVALGPCCDVV